MVTWERAAETARAKRRRACLRTLSALIASRRARRSSRCSRPRRCYRCDSIVEPRLSDQWFVKMKPLAEPVLAAYRKGEYAIVPERWNATFEHWMENIRD